MHRRKRKDEPVEPTPLNNLDRPILDSNSSVKLHEEKKSKQFSIIMEIKDD